MKKRILALDLGDSWIGVANTDITQTIVTPLKIWKSNELFQELENYINKYFPEKIIIGLPITMNNKNSEQTNKVIKIKNEIEVYLKNNINEKINKIEIIFLDERLSSTFAKNIQIQNKSQHKNKEQSIAASIILQNYLNKFSML